MEGGEDTVRPTLSPTTGELSFRRWLARDARIQGTTPHPTAYGAGTGTGTGAQHPPESHIWPAADATNRNGGVPTSTNRRLGMFRLRPAVYARACGPHVDQLAHVECCARSGERPALLARVVSSDPIRAEEPTERPTFRRGCSREDSMSLISFLATAAQRRPHDGTPLRVAPCSTWANDSESDGWEVVHLENDVFLIAGTSASLAPKGQCVTADSAAAYATPCDGSTAQQFRNIADKSSGNYKFQSVVDKSRCLMVASTSYSLGPFVLMAPCEQHRGAGTYPYGPAMEKSMSWAVEKAKDEQSYAIRSLGGSCCGDTFQTQAVCLALDTFPTCADDALKNEPWCDTTLGASARAQALLAKMSTLEKASNMDSHNFGVPRLGMPPTPYSEALHGMCAGCGAAHDFGDYLSTGCPTSFPQVSF